MTIDCLALQPTVAPAAPAVTNLLSDAATLARRLDDAVAAKDWLDAYLFAASLWQLTEDRLHADPFLLNRAANYLRTGASPLSRSVAMMAWAGSASARSGRDLVRPQLRSARSALAALTAILADHVMCARDPHDLGPLVGQILPAVPRLRGDVLRVPTCFHSFDQHPDDVRWLAEEFTRRYPPSPRPLCVVGVRTSGCFLGPLLGVALHSAGHEAVSALTYRPGWPFSRWERNLLRSAEAAGGQVLVIDDPPGSGTSLASAAGQVSRAGVPDSRIVLLFSMFGSASIPDRLSAWPVVAQPWSQWRVHARLRADVVKETLESLLGNGTAVGEVRPLPLLAAAGDRAHVRARFAVELTDSRTGATTSRDILVEGAGLGYLGRQALAVGGALPDQVPKVHGFAAGLLYRDWLPDPAQNVPAGALKDVISRYVICRRAALPAPGASVARLGGRDPVW